MGPRAERERQVAVLPHRGAAAAAGRRRDVFGRCARDQRWLRGGAAPARRGRDGVRHVQGGGAPPDARAGGQARAPPERRPHPRERDRAGARSEQNDEGHHGDHGRGARGPRAVHPDPALRVRPRHGGAGDLPGVQGVRLDHGRGGRCGRRTGVRDRDGHGLQA
ncbi:hypothetical protein PybrP1_006306, partial [[Pythium] brassicae (nom. inval.)]